MEDDPLLELARMEAELSEDGPPVKPFAVKRPPMEAKNYNAGDGSAHAARRSTSHSTPGMIPISQNDQNMIAARAESIPTDRTLVRPLPPPVVHRNSNTLFRPGASNANNISKYGNGAAMAAPSSSRGYKDLGQGSLIRKCSGLNVTNPLVSSSQLQARLEAQSVLKLSDIQKTNHTVGVPKTWATVAAIGEMSSRLEDSQGRPYAIWKLTDLKDTMITVFLFGSAYSDCHRDGRPGTVVALFSPKVRSEGGKFSLSITSGDTLLELGTASEFGFCQSKTKNGEQCKVPVNTTHCAFCSHHVQKEYHSLQSKRHELQGNSLKSAFQHGMKSKLHWNAGQFQPLNASVRPRMAAASAAQLKQAAAAAAARGASSGARYMNTVADPTGARSAAQEIETSRLRNNTLAPGSAPIPLARVSKVVYQDPTPARKKRGNGSGSGAGGSAPAGASAQNKRPRVGGVPATKDTADDDDTLIELEDDDIFDDMPPQVPPPRLQRGVAKQPLGSAAAGGGGGELRRSNGPPSQPPPRTAPAPAPVAARKPPAIEMDAAKQRAIEIRKSKNAEAKTLGIPANILKSTPAFLMAPLIEKEKEKERAEREQDEDYEVELDGGEDDNEDFTIAARHITGDNNGSGSNTGRNPKFSTVDKKNFFGENPTRPPPPRTGQTSSSIIPGLGKPASKSGGSATNPGKTYFINGTTSNTVRGKVGARSAGGGAGGGSAAGAKTGFAAAFGSVIAEMELAEASNPHNNKPKGSLYQDLVEQEDTDQLFNILGVLEKKDNIATKMDGIKTLNVTAWKCDVCCSTTEYRPKACGESHPHALTKMQVNKRWWQCGGCKGRFHTLGVRYPTSRCPKCDVLGTDFNQVSMLKPQKKLDHETQQGNIAGRELLVARGAEQKWVNQ